MERRHPPASAAPPGPMSYPIVWAAALATFLLTTALWSMGVHGPAFWIAPGGSTLAACTVGLALGWGVWISSVARGFVGASTGYGFSLACFGLLCRVKLRWLMYFVGPPSGYDWRDRAPFPPPLAADATALAWIHRNGGLFVFGFGLGLVLFESVRWRARLRQGPGWIPFDA